MAGISGKAARRIASDKERISKIVKWLLIALCVQFLFYLVLLNVTPFAKDMNKDGKISYDEVSSFYTETWYRYKGQGATQEVDDGMQFIHTYNLILLGINLCVCVYYLVVIMEEYEGTFSLRVKQFFKQNKGLFFLLLFLTWVFISSLFAYDKFRSFIGCYNLRDGFISFMFYGSILTNVLLLGKDKPKVKKLVINLLLITATIIAGITIFDYHMLIKGVNLTDLHYPVVQRYSLSLGNVTASVFNNSNHYGYFLSIVTIVAAAMFVKATSKGSNKIIMKENTNPSETTKTQLEEIQLKVQERKELKRIRIGLYFAGWIISGLLMLFLWLNNLYLIALWGSILVSALLLTIVNVLYKKIRKSKCISWGYQQEIKDKKKGASYYAVDSVLTVFLALPAYVFLALPAYVFISVFYLYGGAADRSLYSNFFINVVIMLFVNYYPLMLLTNYLSNVITSFLMKYSRKKQKNTYSIVVYQKIEEKESFGLFVLKAALYLVSFCILTYMLILNDTFGSYLGVLVALFMMLIHAIGMFIYEIIKKEKLSYHELIGAILVFAIFIGASYTVTNSNGIVIAKRNIEATSKDISAIFSTLSSKNNTENENAVEQEIGTTSETTEEIAANAGSGRWTLWKNTFKIAVGDVKTFFLGRGLENLIYTLKNANGDGEGRSHNLVLQLAATVGFPGMILYFLGIGWIFISNLRNIKYWDTFVYTGMFVIISYMISSFTGNSGFYTSGYFYIFVGFVVIGMIELRENKLIEQQKVHK